MSDRIDVAVIGAGVIGLAIARAFARAGREVVVLEKNTVIGAETSSRNSEVIHAGLYYRPGGLRARLCVAGKQSLYEFCEDYGVGHQRCEKLIVAINDAEIAGLAAIRKNAEACGVGDLEMLSGAEAARLEPGLRCQAALRSPSTGVIDSHALMLALQGSIEDAGGVVVCDSPVLGGEIRREGVILRIGGAAPSEAIADLVINSAGLHCEKVARSLSGLDPQFIPRLRYAKGQYFTVTGRAPFLRAIYPLPSPDCLGVHYTRDLGGQAKIGPDIDWDTCLDDYRVDETRRRALWESALGFWPDLDQSRLVPGYAGLRPKIAGPGEESDFRIDGPEVHGVTRLINLFGIESPGLTSCLAIGEHVRRLAARSPLNQ